MTTFIDKRWDDALVKVCRSARREILLMTPFIQGDVVRRLLRRKSVGLRVITRYSLTDFHDGVSDIDALAFLLSRHAKIKGVRNLHSKVYIFDGKRAVVTSANLTQAALRAIPRACGKQA